MAYKCNQCGSEQHFGMRIGFGNQPPLCQSCKSLMIEIQGSSQFNVSTGHQANIETGKAKITIGGNLTNKGNFKAHETDISISGDLKNEGDFFVNNPEKIKEILLEIARSTKDVTAIGKMVVEKILGNK